ncbi:MAG: phosphatase PAP2 family protein [Rhodospirillaceae bacterium]|nr:phosphatase PAP2 family protein [Rhodospirillaceae bacterium]
MPATMLPESPPNQPPNVPFDAAMTPPSAGAPTSPHREWWRRVGQEPWIFLWLALLLLPLTLWPQADLAVSGWFFTAGQGFLWQQSPWVGQLSRLVHLTSWAVGIGLLLAIGWGIVRAIAGSSKPGGKAAIWPPKRMLRGMPPRQRRLLYLLIVLMLAPGLLVNSVVKPSFGRARPHQVTDFGGSQQFSAAWIPAHQCSRNCSFVSGDAGVGFALLTPAWIAQGRRNRRRWLMVGMAVGLAVSLPRLGAGKHFLSDLLWAGWMVALSGWLIARRLIARGWLQPTPANGGADGDAALG